MGVSLARASKRPRAQRTVRWLVHFRRMQPDYAPISHDAFTRERQRLLELGRNEAEQAASARREADARARGGGGVGGAALDVGDDELAEIAQMIESRERQVSEAATGTTTRARYSRRARVLLSLTRARARPPPRPTSTRR